MLLTCSVGLSPTRPIAYYEQFDARVYNVRTILWHKTMAFGVAVMPIEERAAGRGETKFCSRGAAPRSSRAANYWRPGSS
jgi:hypothetical protein